MAHIVEVDQSIKFENTKRDTVLAFSNAITFTMLIPASVKRDCVTLLRKKITSGSTLYTQLFATCLFLLLKDYMNQLGVVIIDGEYTGKEAQIKQHLLHLFRNRGYTVDSQQITFGYIGKQSPAHEAAIETLRGNVNPNLIVRLEDILAYFKI